MSAKKKSSKKAPKKAPEEEVPPEVEQAEQPQVEQLQTLGQFEVEVQRRPVGYDRITAALEAAARVAGVQRARTLKEQADQKGLLNLIRHALLLRGVELAAAAEQAGRHQATIEKVELTKLDSVKSHLIKPESGGDDDGQEDSGKSEGA